MLDKKNSRWPVNPFRSVRKGFTLLETIIVMMMLTILSVTLMVKLSFFSNQDEWKASQQLAPVLLKAQQLAVANHRTIYILASASDIKVCYDSTCNNPCKRMDGLNVSVQVPSGSLINTSSGFSFDPEGKPSSGWQTTYNGVTVSVSQDTGWING